MARILVLLGLWIGMAWPLGAAEETRFVYFNEEWIQGASVEMLAEEDILGREIKLDEWGNRATFITVSPENFEILKRRVDEKYGHVWIHDDPTCEFPGGPSKMLEWLGQNLRFPEGFEGNERVIVKFKVQPDGKVTDGKIMRAAKNEKLNEEALRIVSIMPDFHVEYYTPKRAPIHFTLPIRFNSSSKKTDDEPTE